MTQETRMNGQVFRKSQYSKANSGCVGVAIEAEKVSIINTKTKLSIVDFTHNEWEKFILGVKDGEFDLLED